MDNMDQYEDFRHALTEVMAQDFTDTFLDFAVKPYIKPEEGSVILMNDDGHVALYRDVDGYFHTRTDVTEEIWDKVVEKIDEVTDEFPELDGIDLIIKAGWRVI